MRLPIRLNIHLDFALIATQPHPLYGLLKSNPPQGCRQRFLGAIPSKSAVCQNCSKPVGTSQFLPQDFLEMCNQCLGIFSPSASACDIQGWIGNINGGEDNMPLINWLRKVKRLKVSSFDLRLRRALSLTPNVNSN